MIIFKKCINGMLLKIMMPTTVYTFMNVDHLTYIEILRAARTSYVIKELCIIVIKRGFT